MASISGLGIMSPDGEESGYFLSLLALPQGIGYRIKEPNLHPITASAFPIGNTSSTHGKIAPLHATRSLIRRQL